MQAREKGLEKGILSQQNNENLTSFSSVGFKTTITLDDTILASCHYRINVEDFKFKK